LERSIGQGGKYLCVSWVYGDEHSNVSAVSNVVPDCSNTGVSLVDASYAYVVYSTRNRWSAGSPW